MRRLILKGIAKWKVRSVALHVVEHLPEKDWRGEIRAVFDFVRYKIRYVKDIDGIETVLDPDKTLMIGQGDCDDKVVLGASLLKSIGYPVKLIAVGFNGRVFSHVFLAVWVEQEHAWIPMELIGGLPFGVAPPNITSKLEVLV